MLCRTLTSSESGVMPTRLLYSRNCLEIKLKLLYSCSYYCSNVRVRGAYSLIIILGGGGGGNRLEAKTVVASAAVQGREFHRLLLKAHATLSSIGVWRSHLSCPSTIHLIYDPKDEVGASLSPF